MKIYRLFLSLIVFVLIGVSCYALNTDFLYPRKIEASSYLFQGDLLIKDNYHPYYVIDDNPNTAWVEGVSGDGLGEHIITYCSLPKNQTVLVLIKNGYQKSEDLFYENNRVKELEVNLTSGTANKPKITSQIYNLKDEMGWQQLNIRPEEDCWAITFIIRSVYNGTKFEDTCISDIKIISENANLINVKSQETLKNQYDNWFDERKKKAGFFSNLPKDYPLKVYKKTTYQKNVNENSCPLLDIDYFNRVLKNDELMKFSLSPVGINYTRMINNKEFSSECVSTINSKREFYFPDIFPENIFQDINSYINIANLRIKPSNSKVNPGEMFQKVFYVGKSIRVIDWGMLLENKYEKTISRNYYDDKGKLIYIKGQFSGEDGECANDALFVWNNGKITHIFLFFVQWGNKGGLDIQLTVYE